MSPAPVYLMIWWEWLTNQRGTLIQFAKFQSTVLWGSQLFLPNLWGSPFLFSLRRSLWKSAYWVVCLLSLNQPWVWVLLGRLSGSHWESDHRSYTPPLPPCTNMIMWVPLQQACHWVKTPQQAPPLETPACTPLKKRLSHISNPGGHVCGPTASSAICSRPGPCNNEHRRQLSPAPEPRIWHF